MFLYDATDMISVKYNPSRRDFFSFILPKLPSLQEFTVAALDKDKFMIKFCETGKLGQSQYLDLV